MNLVVRLRVSVFKRFARLILFGRVVIMGLGGSTFLAFKPEDIAARILKPQTTNQANNGTDVGAQGQDVLNSPSSSWAPESRVRGG